MPEKKPATLRCAGTKPNELYQKQTMSTQIETLEIEIVPADSGLEIAAKTSLELAFAGYFTEAGKWKSHAATITDPKLARTARLELKRLRVDAENTRKSLKEDSLRMGKAIDGANNILLALIVPIEQSLEEIEKQEERRIEREKAARTAERHELLRPFLDLSLPLPNVADLTSDQFDRMLADTKFLHESRIAAAKKAEEEKALREKQEAEERARIEVENAKLKAEAEEREKSMKAEREAAEKARIEAEAKAKAEREKIELAARLEREKAETARKDAEKKAAEERAKIEAAAAKAQAEAKALREAEAKRVADELEAKAKAEAAPDKEKLASFVASIRALELPILATQKAVQFRIELSEQVEKFAAWVEKKSANL